MYVSSIWWLLRSYKNALLVQFFCCDLVGKDFLIISSESQALFEKEGNVLGFWKSVLCLQLLSISKPWVTHTLVHVDILCIIVKEKYTAFMKASVLLIDKVVLSLFMVEFDKLTRKTPLIFFAHKPPRLLEESSVCVSVCPGGLVLDCPWLDLMVYKMEN